MEALSSQALIAGAKKFRWRCKWQPENPKQSGSLSETRYSPYCTATTHAEALELGAKPADLSNDLAMGFLEIFSDPLRIAPSAAEDTAVGGMGKRHQCRRRYRRS